MSAKARGASNRSALGFGTGAATAGARSPLPSPPPPMSGKPLAATTISPAPRTSWTTSATTSTRTDSPPRRSDSVVGRHRLEQIGELAPRRLAAGRHVLAGHLVGRRLVAAQDLACDRLAVDLVGAVVEARGARVAIHGLERQVGRVAQRAVDLHRAVDDVVQHAGAEELDQRDLLARGAGALGVDHPRR